MFKLLHTADWQMGMMAPGLGGAAEQARAARLDSLSRLLSLANERKVDAILVAGDQFEDNQVKNATVEQVVGRLNDETQIPTYIIPGNHDPFSRDSVYRRPAWSQLREHVHVLTEAEPLDLAEGVMLFPCPLHRKNGAEDPTAWIPPRQDGDGIRIGLAHGSMPIHDAIGADDFPIALDRAERSGLDYLALGHWHSTLGYPQGPAARTYYSGTHEVTSFGERDSGNVLLVTIEGPGATPQVEAIHTGKLNWQDLPVDLDNNPLAESVSKLREMADAADCLLRITMVGGATADYVSQLQDLSAMLKERFLFHRIDDSQVRPAGLDKSFGELISSPYVKQAAEELLQLAEGPAGEPTERSPVVARRALQMLQQAVWEQRGGEGGDSE